ncbi:hypothetical protein [Halomonas rhizosphaerae]|uniref:Uncharacterized protein n=1 Tax=Halomonas rhizosphaerae TaxID=3043296 RepID=A0ABT6V2W8_9GAMM|nr:hypothetical protein [Halomonas rhizosphaerae]MDI5892554.1 hypothetical protein [Halomonas rhizosphaerae]
MIEAIPLSATALLPIGLSVLRLVAERSGESVKTTTPGHDHHQACHVDFNFDDNIKRFGVCLLIAIAWPASMGGLGNATGRHAPNAIVFDTGAVNIARMARGGVILNVLGIALITLFCYMLGGFAFGLQF